MRLGRFLQDRLIALVIYIVTLALFYIFMKAYAVDLHAFVAILIVYVFAVSSSLCWDYFRKRAFFRKLLTDLEGLDKKYLVAEMIDHAGFYEGEILLDVLRDCNKSMAEQVASYRKSSNDFREYIEMWVHEIKIPVAAIRLICHNNPELDHRLVQQVKLIDDDINNVLFYSRSEHAHKDYRIKEVKLNKVFGNVALGNRQALQLINAMLETEGLDVSVMTDDKWLEFILGQIVSNSMKYHATDRDLHIQVFAIESEDAVELHCRDNGIGIPSSDLSRVFDKTFTGENGRTGAKSTGMGLFIVKKLCDQLGHGIRILSEVNQYTEVILTFPKNDYYKM